MMNAEAVGNWGDLPGARAGSDAIGLRRPARAPARPKDLLSVFLLTGGGLPGIEALFQAEPGLGLTEGQDAGTARQLEEKHFNIGVS